MCKRNDNDRKKIARSRNYTLPAIIGALVLIVASVAFIVMKIAQQEQLYREKWGDYDDCGLV